MLLTSSEVKQKKINGLLVIRLVNKYTYINYSFYARATPSIFETICVWWLWKKVHIFFLSRETENSAAK